MKSWDDHPTVRPMPKTSFCQCSFSLVLLCDFLQTEKKSDVQGLICFVSRTTPPLIIVACSYVSHLFIWDKACMLAPSHEYLGAPQCSSRNRWEDSRFLHCCYILSTDSPTGAVSASEGERARPTTIRAWRKRKIRIIFFILITGLGCIALLRILTVAPANLEVLCREQRTMTL